jgi:hypothetical protein
MNSQQKSIVIGVILGAGLGALGGFLFARGLDVPREEGSKGLSLQAVPPGEMVKVLIAVLGVLRGIAELGQRV